MSLSSRQCDDALKSLQWYRGWVRAENVATEFRDLKRYCSWTKSCRRCQKLCIKCGHAEPTILDKFKAMKRKRLLKPFSIIQIMSIFSLFSTGCAMRPYIIPILNAYGIPIDVNLSTIIFSLLSVAANVCLLFSVQLFGKRKIYLSAMLVVILTCFSLSKLS